VNVLHEPALYTGKLRHRRFRPTPHQFTYSLFMVLLDIDAIPQTMARSRFSSYNRFNWASFHEADHFGDPAQSLRQRLTHDAAQQGIRLPDGPILLLTHLRYLGYCFNPISFFFCYEKAGGKPIVMAEVNSTFGESRNYWLGDWNAFGDGESLRFRCPKTMHVSPFMAMNLDYEFVVTEPAERLIAHMNTLDNGQGFFDATLTLDRRPWTAGTLTSALLRHPAMTAKVIAAIHWEALRLWAKRVPVFTHPDRIPDRDPLPKEAPHSK